MQTLFDQISQVVGITLLHSLWQGLLLYTLLRIFIVSAPAATSTAKYAAGLFALAASVVWPVITFFIELHKHPIVQPLVGTTDDLLPYIPLNHTLPALSPEKLTSSFNIDAYTPYLMAFWLIGIAFNSARLLWGWRNLSQVKRSFIDAPVLQKRALELAKLIDLSKKIRVFMSERVDVPCIIGYLKPTIILPVSVVTQFSAEQIESILLHEMAHVRRNDYLVNILQQIAGILFFFNPFTQLINRIIYNEREHSCDDLVLKTTGKPMVYAHALLQLEEMRQSDWQLALAATGKKYYLLNRIKRIMETKKQVNNFRHILVAILLLTCSMGTIAWLNPELKDGKLIVNPIELPNILNMPADSLKKTTKLKKTTTASQKSTTAKQVYAKGAVNIAYTSKYSADDPQLNKLAAEVEKRAEALQKLYSGPEWEKLQRESEKRSAIVDSFYNRPDIKKLQDSLDKQSVAFEKIAQSPEIKDLEKQMEALGKQIERHYNSSEFKNLEKIMELQSKLVTEQTGAKSAEYQKQRAALNKTEAEIRRLSNDPEIKKSEEQIRTLSKQMQGFYQSDAYKTQNEAIRRESAEMRKMYNDPAVKQQTEELKILGKQMRDYQKSPAIARQKAELKQAEATLNAYRQSPEFKKHQEKIQAELNKLMKGMKYSVTADTTSSGK
jgi:bla regulator protein BlaR1